MAWFFVVKKCSQIKSLGKKVVHNCHRKITTGLSKEFNYKKLWMMQMTHLSKEAIAFKPELTAARFFIIEYRSFVTVFNMLTTFVIVIVQYSNTN